MKAIKPDNSSGQRKIRVCKRCGCAVFYAHQVVRMDIICDGNGNFEENVSDNPASDIYDSEPPYGPFTCKECGAEYEDLNELDVIEPITKDEIAHALSSGTAVLKDDPYRTRRRAVNIQWDTDDGFTDLPSELDIPDDITSLDEISDFLSDLTGFCHFGFDVVYKEDGQ